MKSLRDYLEESDYAASNPVAGDTFAINIREECLIESVVVESRSDGVVIAADDRMIELLESYGYTFEQTCMECGGSGCGCGQAPEEYGDETDAGQNPGEYDQEGDMAKDELLTVIRSARRLIGMLDNNDNMPEWTQKKITKSADYVDTAADYISSQKERGVMEQGMAEGPEQQLSIQQLATISDEALDNAYQYGRSTPGNTFGWQANMKSAAYAKQMIDQGVTDIEAISDAIHKGWNTTAQAFVKNPEQFDDTAKLKAAGKLEAKLQQRAQLMKQNYAQLPEEEKEKDRVVARALLKALRGSQDMAEGSGESSPVARAVLHRIMMQHTGLLAAHGPERVMNAVDELADRVNIGPDDEIGSSDVSAYVREVERALSNPDLSEQGGFNDDGSYNTSDDEATDFDEYDFDDTELGEGWKEKLGAAALAGSMAFGAGAAQAQSATKNQVSAKPVATQQASAKSDPFTVNGNTMRKDVRAAIMKMPDEDGQQAFFAWRILNDDTKSDQVRFQAGQILGQLLQKHSVKEQDMTEDLQADDGERYRSADDFFGQFEADHFDEERVSSDGMEVRGYIDGVNVMVWRFNSPRKTSGYGIYNDSGLNEAEYQGRKVPLGKPMQGDVAKSKVYVKDPKTGNVKKVNFGDPNMKIKKSNPARRKSFRARHNCDNPGPRTKARYWSCRAW